MRVLHVIPSIGPLRGGPSVAMGVIARALRDAGVDVDVATTNDNDRELLQVPIGTPVHENGVRYWYFERTAHPYTTSTGLARWLRGNIAQYQVVHAHALFSFSTSVTTATARKSRVPYIVRPLGTLATYGMQQHSFLKRASWLMLERRILRNAAGVHFTSEAEKQEAERLGPWRSFVVPIGVEPFAGDRSTAPEQLTYLFLGRIHPKKRVDLLLDAFAQVKRTAPAAKLVIAGTGADEYVRALKEHASRLELENAVTWTGHVSGTEKLRVLEAASVFVLPSVNENFGIAPVEALAAGIPVVLTRGVAIHREVEDYGAGIIVDDDTASLTAGMLYLRGVEERSAMALRARRLAQEKFSIEAMQRGLLAMYQQVASA
ncbi:MAG TPA: glycosyltransferase [Longimicrobiales bacterium]